MTGFNKRPILPYRQPRVDMEKTNEVTRLLIDRGEQDLLIERMREQIEKLETRIMELTAPKPAVGPEEYRRDFERRFGND
jgi:hypothetical protein